MKFFVFPCLYDGEKTFSSDEPIGTFTDFEEAKKTADKIAEEYALSQKWLVVNGVVTSSKESCYHGVLYYMQYTQKEYQDKLDEQRATREFEEALEELKSRRFF